MSTNWKKLCLLLVAMSAVFLALLWFGRPSDFPKQVRTSSGDQEKESAQALSAEEARHEMELIPDLRLSSSGPRLTPDLVIGNPDCNFRAGHGNASGVGMVVVPVREGSRFEVLDSSGFVFGDKLPFVPNHLYLAKHEDGSILAGVGDLRLNEIATRSNDASEPVRVYRDGALVFEAEDAMDFGLASDGSSFFVIERTAGGTSQLLIHNVDRGATYHHDLGYDYTARVNDYPYGATFTTNNAEVMLVPSSVVGSDAHHFFSSDGQPRRTITLEGSGDVVFESSNYGYYAFGQGMDRPFLFKKKEFRWDSYGQGITSLDVWATEIDLELGNLELSSDGRWLVLNAWVMHVLDAETGEVVFKFPVATPYADEQLVRLSPVLDFGATVKDIGGVGSVQIVDGQLLMFRRVYDREVPRKRRYYYDVFDMLSIQLDSKPTLRVEVDRERGCMAGDFFLRGLQVVDDQLTYLTQERGTAYVN